VALTKLVGARDPGPAGAQLQHDDAKQMPTPTVVPCGSRETVARVPRAHQSFGEPLLETLERTLRLQHLLLILDNGEHVCSDALSWSTEYCAVARA